MNIHVVFLKLFYKLPEVDLDSIVKSEANNINVKNILLDDICMPPFLGTKNFDDIGTLLKITLDRKPLIIFEIGTAHGNTVANIINNHKVEKFYTVNATPEQISGGVITYKLSKNEIGRVYKKYNFSKYVEQIYENSINLDLDKFNVKNGIDLAIIDGCHDSEFVLNDFHKVKPYLNRSGIILLHDTHPSMHGHLSGSYIACLKLRKEGFNIQHIKNTWWGLYIKDQ